MGYYADSNWTIEFTDSEAKTAAEAALAKDYPEIQHGWPCMIGEDGDEFFDADLFIVTTHGKYFADEDRIFTIIAPFVKSAVAEFTNDSGDGRWRVMLVDGKPVTETDLDVWADHPEEIVELVNLDGAKRIYAALIAKYGAEEFTAS